MNLVDGTPPLLLCYFLGGLSPSWLAVKCLAGKDLRDCGTGTLGATNAGRVLGRKVYVIVALVDILKGWSAMWIAEMMGLQGWWLFAAGLAAALGHVWPALLKFKGGKGMAPAYGVILFSAPWAALLMWLVFGAGRLALRNTTLGAMQAFLAAPLLAISLAIPLVGLEAGSALFAALALLLFWTHWQNIKTALQRRKAEAASP